MRWSRLVAVGLFCGFSPVIMAGQTTPSPLQVRHLRQVYEAILQLPAGDVGNAMARLSSSDREGLIWLIRNMQTAESVTVPTYTAPSYSAPSRSTPRYTAPTYTPPAAYSAPTYTSSRYSPPTYPSTPIAKPRSSYSSGYSYQPSTVVTANPYIGSAISNYDPRVNKYSTDGAQNKYTTGGGRVYAADGTYLGKLNANKYDPESVANPYGQYGSKYSSTSINNPYSQYGSKYSAQSATNPYTVTPPRVIYGDTTRRW